MPLLRQVLLAIALFAALATYLFVTRQRVHAAEQAAVAAQVQARNLAGQLRAAQSTERIVTRYVDRVQRVRERGATLVQKVPVYVPAQADTACTVPRGFVRLHDAAAQGAPVPDTAAAADAQPSGLALSAATGVVVDNYTTCRATAEQLSALQDWVRVYSQGTP